jgi:hypothetical protein
MSGILDNKSRVLDTVITTEGRRQLAEGGVDIQYVTFTDGSTFYKADVASGSQDATKRIYLESCQLPQDDITFRADDDGNLVTFRNSDNVQVSGGRILSYTFQASTASIITGSTQGVSQLVGDQFTDSVRTLLASTTENFKKLRLIASKDKIFEDDGFGMGPNEISYVITNERPISNQQQHVAHMGAVDSIFADPRFSHMPNFRYLPPINKTLDKSIDRSDPQAIQSYCLGYYTPWGRSQMERLSYKQVMSELQYYSDLGYMRSINIDPTSRDNNLIGQFFEKAYNTIKKLDVIDFGTHQTGNSSAPVAQIFFVGKVEVDEKGTDTFLHLFTLVFE